MHQDCAYARLLGDEYTFDFPPHHSVVSSQPPPVARSLPPQPLLQEPPHLSCLWALSPPPPLPASLTTFSADSAPGVT